MCIELISLDWVHFVVLHWVYRYQPSRDNRDLYLVDYNALYVDTVRHNLIREIGYETPFVVSSPSQGPLSEGPDVPFVQRWGNAGNISFGDMHFCNFNTHTARLMCLRYE